MVRLKLLIIFLVLVACDGALAQNLGIHPTTLEFRLNKGQTESQAIHLSNGSEKKVQFKLYLNDWLRDSVGGHAYYRADTLQQSCSRWVTMDKSFVELDPGKSADVTVKLTLPDSAIAINEMKWSMLFIETVEEQNAAAAKGAQAAVRNLLRMGVHIYQTPPNVTEKLVKVFDVTKVPGEANAYQILCQNIGKVMIECSSYIELASLTDGKKVKLNPIEYPLFPNQKRFVKFNLPKDLPKGKYSALAVVDAGEDVSLEAVESTIEIK
jgi:hypothetical protein